MLTLHVEAETISQLSEKVKAAMNGIVLSNVIRDASPEMIRPGIDTAPNTFIPTSAAVVEAPKSKRGRAASAEPAISPDATGRVMAGSAPDAGKGAASLPPGVAAPSEPASTAVSFDPFNQPAAESVVTLDQVLATGQAFVGKHGIAPLQPIFESFGLRGAEASFKKMDPSLYGKVYAKMNEMLKP